MRVPLFLLTLTLLGASAPHPITANTAATIDALARRTLANQDVPGMSIAIAERGAIVYAKGFGLRDVDDALPADANTAYPIGSNTKQFVAAAILLLQHDGKLDIRDRLSKYVPTAPHAGEITIEELLAQTSGLPDYTQTPAYEKSFRNPTDPAGILRTIAKMPLDFPPGSNWEYSNTNYVALSMVIAKASGTPYRTFLAKRVLQPVGLKARFYSHNSVRADTARGYTEFALGTPTHAPYEDTSWFPGTGDLAMSAVDLARWDIALASGTVIPAQAFSAMSTSKRLPDGKPTFYGFGLGAGHTFLGHAMVGHLGRVSGFISLDMLFPQDGLALIILGNGDNFAPAPLAHQIAALLYGKPVPYRAQPALTQTRAEVSNARAWLARALSGRITLAQTTQGFEQTFMPTPAQMSARLADLRALGRRVGPPLQMELISRDGPPGEQAYAYRVTFAHATLEFDFALNGAKLDYLNFQPVYDY